MDGRESMSNTGGGNSYYGLSDMRQMPNPNMSNPNMSGQQVRHFGGGSFQLDSLTSSMSMLSNPSNAVNVGAGGSGAGQGEVKRKRGRPRKYGPDGSVALALSPPISSAMPTPRSGSVSVSASGSGSVGLKRGRGRPPGTGRKQQLASLGEWLSGSAGMSFTPHIITIGVGEDIATKIMSFSQQGPRAVSILSASGAVSTVALRQSGTSGGTVTYEGRFEIVCLSGSYLLTDEGGSRVRSGGLRVSLAYPDHRVIGGGVGGLLIAASPVQVVVGSFLYGGSKAKNKAKTDESGPDHELHSPDMGGLQSVPTSAMPDQTLSPQVMGGWPGSRQMDMRNIDIDLTRG